jgi:hypothetical protein
MGWMIDSLVDLFWVDFVLRKTRGKPWWVRILWAASPIIFLAAFAGLIWLLMRT